MTAPVPAPAPKKLSLKQLAADILADLIGLEAALPTIDALAKNWLPQTDMQYLVIAGVVVGGVVSILRQLVAKPVVAALRARS